MKFIIVSIVLGVGTACVVAWLCIRAWKKGPIGRITAITVPCVLLTVISHALIREQAESSAIDAQRTALESALRTSLRVGDDAEKIERVLRKMHLKFTFSDALRGYFAPVYTGKSDTRIEVIVAVDSGQRVQSVDVKVLVTFL